MGTELALVILHFHPIKFQSRSLCSPGIYLVLKFCSDPGSNGLSKYLSEIQLKHNWLDNLTNVIRALDKFLQSFQSSTHYRVLPGVERQLYWDDQLRNDWQNFLAAASGQQVINSLNSKEDIGMLSLSQPIEEER